MGPVHWGQRRLSPGFLRKNQQMERYICGSGPLFEEKMMDLVEFNNQVIEIEVEETLIEEVESDLMPEVEVIEEAEQANPAVNIQDLEPSLEEEFLAEMRFNVEETYISQTEKEESTGPPIMTFMEDKSSTSQETITEEEIIVTENSPEATATSGASKVLDMISICRVSLFTFSVTMALW